MDELSTYLNRLRIFLQNLINDLQDQVAHTPAYNCNRVHTIDILYTLDSASTYSAIPKLKP